MQVRCRFFGYTISGTQKCVSGTPMYIGCVSDTRKRVSAFRCVRVPLTSRRKLAVTMTSFSLSGLSPSSTRSTAPVLSGTSPPNSSWRNSSKSSSSSKVCTWNIPDFINEGNFMPSYAKWVKPFFIYFIYMVKSDFSGQGARSYELTFKINK